jgi:hypothetical protein
MSTSSISTRVTPITLSISSSLRWSLGMLLLGMLIYYFIGVDQGMTSVFGSDMHIHEFVHDSRHFLGFPCH